MPHRKHIPALNPLELEAALARLEKTRLSPDGKRMIRQMLQAASNRDSEAPEVVIRTLAPERRADIEQTQREIGGLMLGVLRRGGAGLNAISDVEWGRLTAEAVNDD